MDALRQCEFFLLRYVPNVVQGQPANIGMVLLEVGAGEQGFVGVRFTTDWRLVRLLDPHFDVEVLEAFEDELRRMLESRLPEIINYRPPLSRQDWILQQLQNSFSNIVQVAPVKLVETKSPQAELKELARMYFTLPALEREVQAGVVHIRTAIRSAFEEPGRLAVHAQEHRRWGTASKGDN